MIHLFVVMFLVILLYNLVWQCMYLVPINLLNYRKNTYIEIVVVYVLQQKRSWNFVYVSFSLQPTAHCPQPHHIHFHWFFHNCVIVCLNLQIFLLNGRLIFGPDVRSLFLTIFLIVAPVILFSAFVSQRLILEFPHNLGNLILAICILFTIYVSDFLPLFPLLFFSYIILTITTILIFPTSYSFFLMACSSFPFLIRLV